MIPAPDNLPSRERVEALLRDAIDEFDRVVAGEDEYAAAFWGPMTYVLRAYLRLTQENEWIALKERFPDVPGNYLIAVVDLRRPEWPPERQIAYFRGGKHFFTSQTHFVENVTHWRDLPPPPSENSTGGGKSE